MSDDLAKVSDWWSFLHVSDKCKLINLDSAEDDDNDDDEVDDTDAWKAEAWVEADWFKNVMNSPYVNESNNDATQWQRLWNISEESEDEVENLEMHWQSL
jgi:hypothetical protein